MRPDSELAEDQCIIRGEHFFIRALVQIPVVEVERTGHPLAVEQAEGITTARVHELAERLLHG